MKQFITPEKARYILQGANLLGTGGGGTVAMGLPILTMIKNPVMVTSLNDLKPSSAVCTAFGVGGKQNADPIKAITNSLRVFQKIYRKKIQAIIPVEVGAESIATSMLVSSVLNLPLLDADIVGLRSSPEIFLETISIGNLSRVPCSIADDKGNSAVLWETQSLEQTENFLRNFAVSCGGDAFVTGYPNTIKELTGVIPENSISLSLQIGEDLKLLKKNKLSLDIFCQKNDLVFLGEGKIISQTKKTSKGFAEGKYIIQNKKTSYTIFYKNENLVLLNEDKILLTCPDSIMLLDTKTYEGINNFNRNTKQSVVILGKKAIPIWRTKEGKKLFSPRNLGYIYKQVLLP